MALMIVSPANGGQRKPFPGHSISLDLPSYYRWSNEGVFTQPELGVIVGLTEVRMTPQQADKIRARFSSEAALKAFGKEVAQQRDLAMQSVESVNLNGGNAYLISFFDTKQPLAGMLLMALSPRNTLVNVVAKYPDTLPEGDTAVVADILRSTRWLNQSQVDVFGGLSYRLKDAGQFRLFNRNPKLAMFVSEELRGTDQANVFSVTEFGDTPGVNPKDLTMGAIEKLTSSIYEVDPNNSVLYENGPVRAGKFLGYHVIIPLKKRKDGQLYDVYYRTVNAKGVVYGFLSEVPNRGKPDSASFREVFKSIDSFETK